MSQILAVKKEAVIMIEKLAYVFCWLLLVAGFSFYTPWMPFGWSIYEAGVGLFILIVLK
jgi:hypothetical protein